MRHVKYFLLLTFLLATVPQVVSQPAGGGYTSRFPRYSTAPTCNSSRKGHPYFDLDDNKAYICDGTSYVEFTTGAAFDLTAAHTFTGQNDFNRTAAGNDACFGGTTADGSSVCIDGDQHLIAFDDGTEDTSIDGSAGDLRFTLDGGTWAVIDGVNTLLAMSVAGELQVIAVAAGADACFGDTSGTAPSICIDGDNHLITLDGATGNATIDGTDTGSLDIAAASTLGLTGPTSVSISSGPATELNFSFQFISAGTSGTWLEPSIELTAMDGTDTVNAFGINITNADHTGASNILNALKIAAIVGDADASEYAINIDGGSESWNASLRFNKGTAADFGALHWFDGGTVRGFIQIDTSDLIVRAQSNDLELFGSSGIHFESNDAADNFTFTPEPNAAGGSSTFITLAATLAAMDGTDTVNGLAINLTNADHTGSTNVLNAISIGVITGDVHAVESAILLSAGWDFFASAAARNITFQINSGFNVGIQNSDLGSPSVAFETTPAEGASSNLVSSFPALNAMNGSDNIRLFFADVTNSPNHTGVSNTLTAFWGDAITGDADALEIGVVIGTGWDYFARHDGIAFASLGTPTNGTATYCTDCVVTTPFVDHTCTSGGSGSWAFRQAGAWKCLG